MLVIFGWVDRIVKMSDVIFVIKKIIIGRSIVGCVLVILW